MGVPLSLLTDWPCDWSPLLRNYPRRFSSDTWLGKYWSCSCTRRSFASVPQSLWFLALNGGDTDTTAAINTLYCTCNSFVRSSLFLTIIVLLQLVLSTQCGRSCREKILLHRALAHCSYPHAGRNGWLFLQLFRFIDPAIVTDALNAQCLSGLLAVWQLAAAWLLPLVTQWSLT